MTATKDTYQTIGAPCSARLKIQGSIFFARAVPIASVTEVTPFLTSLKKELHDATHHCWAYKLDDGVSARVKWSDAGEPKDTAGRPILQAIESRDLTNLLVVVSRWFGGTKLGKGNLSRAYRQAAEQALANAPIVTGCWRTRLRLSVSVEQVSAVYAVAGRFAGRVQVEASDNGGRFTVAVPRSETEKFLELLMERTAGKIQFEYTHAGKAKKRT